ncbi:MAG: acyl-CoA dehydrogenase family protein [Planctomycetota bacterium]|jgi:alkylation response protein AidB-like acyl-CoA dehydrogenase|nr:acyl-CoA dehydrogenase family protein [Planctomycetota bacterium]
MDFELSEELTMVRDMAREFAVAELAPRAAKHDRQGYIDPEVFTQLGELGLWGLTVPEEHGGAGLGNLALAVVLEELNHACASTGVTVSVHNSLLGAPLRRFGSEEQKRTWLPRLATGETIGCYCLTEPNAGSDAASLATTARLEGEEWVLDGTKIWVTNGGIAGLAIVYARTDSEASRAKGISAFLVPMDTPGVEIGKSERKTGIRGSSTTEVVLEGARIPADHLLGERDRGFMIAMDTLDGGRIGIASQAVGIGRACLDASVTYARDREQFGRPIGDFQAVQWKIADMATRLDAARLLTHRAAVVRDSGGRCSLEAAQAKLAASTTANFCADECLQIHGGAGYTDDFEVERLFRDARITEIYEGATDIQRIVISRSLLTA